MPRLVVTLPALHSAQQTIKHERRRFNVLCNGRRFGKNILLQDLAVEGALAKRQPVAWAAPTYKQLLDDWRTLSNTLATVTARRNEQEKQLALLGGGTIDFWSLDNADSIRGRKYARFVINEAGIVTNLMDDWNNVIRPTLIDLRGDVYFSGTPKGMNGFWQLFNHGGDEWARWQMSSYANPHIPAPELDALRETMTDRAFSQEIMAQFLADGAGVFRHVRHLSANANTPPTGGAQYLIGVDWGRSNDETVFSVWDIGARAEVCLERLSDTPYNSQYTRLQALAARYNNALVIAEANNAQDAHVEQLAIRGVRIMPFVTTNATKAAGVDMLTLACERESVTFQADEQGILQMEAFESSRTATGLVKFAAPEGLHDDIVMARVIAYSGIGEHAGPILLKEAADE